MKEMRGHIIDIAFTLALFCLFVVFTLVLVLMGYHVYRDTSAAMGKNYDVRTSLFYITEKSRQAEAVDLGEVGGKDAMILTESYESGVYETWIFVADDDLKEVTVKAGTEVKSGDGQRIMALTGLALTRNGNIVTIAVTDSDGGVTEGMIYAEATP